MAESLLDNTILDLQAFEELPIGCGNIPCFLFAKDTFRKYVRLKSAHMCALSEIQALKEKVKDLEQLAQELYERANLGSDTSGVPSSKDWKNNGSTEAFENTENQESDGKKAPTSEKETPIAVSGYIKGNGGEKKQRGGQKGHAGNSMRFSGEVTEISQFNCYPEKCSGCQRLDQCIDEGKMRRFDTCRAYDIKVVLVQNDYLRYETAECPLDGSSLRAENPLVIGTRFYDVNIRLHVLAWHHLFHGSYERISLAAKEMFGLSLGAGTALDIYKRACDMILRARFMDALRYYPLLFEDVIGFDETSARVCGRNAWVHTAVTGGITLLTAHWRRGYIGATYSGVLQFFEKTIISDCWATYFNEELNAEHHALCCCHILRELVAAAYFRNQVWAIGVFDLLLEVLNEKRKAMENGLKSFSEEYLDDIRNRYRQFVSDGYAEIDGETKGKTFSLLERLKSFEDYVLAFAVNFKVEFTNNAAEISLRDLKVALSVIGQFKTMGGLGDYCIMQSFMDTCRKQERNPYDMMKIVLSGGDIIDAVFGAEKATQIKQMIRLSDAYADNDADQIAAAKSYILFELSDMLLNAASFSPYRVCDDPPPEKKEGSNAAPKDKMAVARERNKPSNSTKFAAHGDSTKTDTSGLSRKKDHRTRAAPKSA